MIGDIAEESPNLATQLLSRTSTTSSSGDTDSVACRLIIIGRLAETREYTCTFVAIQFTLHDHGHLVFNQDIRQVCNSI